MPRLYAYAANKCALDFFMSLNFRVIYAHDTYVFVSLKKCKICENKVLRKFHKIR